MRLNNEHISYIVRRHSITALDCALLILWMGPCLACSILAFDKPSASSRRTPCREYENFVQIGTDQLIARATHREEPDSRLLDLAHVHATIIVRVFVDKRGRVVCDRIVGSANAFLAKLALRAASAWTFEPLVKDGRSTGMQGDLAFHIER